MISLIISVKDKTVSDISYGKVISKVQWLFKEITVKAVSTPVWKSECLKLSKQFYIKEYIKKDK